MYQRYTFAKARDLCFLCTAVMLKTHSGSEAQRGK